MWLLGASLTERAGVVGLDCQTRLFGNNSCLRHVSRRSRGVCSSMGQAGSFGPHKGGQRNRDVACHSPRHPKAVGLETASVSQDCGLELQQWKLKLLFDAPPAADVDLSGASPATQREATEARQSSCAVENWSAQEQQSTQISKTRTSAGNSVVPATNRSRRRSKSAQPKQQRQAMASALGTQLEVVASGDQTVAPARKRVGRPRKSASGSTTTTASGQLAGSTAKPRASRRKAALTAASSDVAVRVTRELDGVQASTKSADCTAGMSCVQQPKKPTAQPSSQPPSASSQPINSSAAAHPALSSSTLVPSTRAAASATVAAPDAQLLPARTRRYRLLAPRVRKPSMSATGASASPALVSAAAPTSPSGQGGSAAGVGQQRSPRVQQPEGERDAVYLAKMRGLLSKGRRRVRTHAETTGAVGVFISRLGNTPVLEKEHEMRLARILQKGARLQSAAASLAEELGRPAATSELAGAVRLSVEEMERRLRNREEAKDLLLQFNLRLVVHLAKRYSNQGVELSDLIQEGETGLRKAIDRFDPERGFRFSTYAHWYIRQPISRAVSEQGRDVRLPVHIHEMLTKINRTEQELNKQPDRREPASREEVARALGMPLPRLMHFLHHSKAPLLVAMEESRGEGATHVTPSMKEMNMHEEWEDETFSQMLEDIDKVEHLKQNLSFVLSTLPKRERNILRLRYGLLLDDSQLDHRLAAYPYPPPVGIVPSGPADAELDAGHSVPADASFASSLAAMDPLAEPGAGGELLGSFFEGDPLQQGTAALKRGSHELSLVEVSYAYGLSKERIRQIEDRALRTLRAPWRMKLLHEINNGNRLSHGTLEHLAQAAHTPARGGAGGAGRW